MTTLQRLNTCYARSTDLLPKWVGPFTLLCMRIWVALAFWHAGVVKLEDPAGTQYLFESMYHVPLLPAGIAAMLGTWIELIVPSAIRKPKAWIG